MDEKQKMEMLLAQALCENDNCEKDKIIDRLVKENSRLREQLVEALTLCAEEIPDGERLSLRGAIRALISKIKKLESQIAEQNLFIKQEYKWHL